MIRNRSRRSGLAPNIEFCGDSAGETLTKSIYSTPQIQYATIRLTVQRLDTVTFFGQTGSESLVSTVSVSKSILP